MLPTKGFWQAIQLVLSLIDGGFLSYLAVYTGINTAKQFGATGTLGGMIGAVSISGNIVALSIVLGLYDEAVPLGSIIITGRGGIIGTIIGVYMLVKVEKSICNIVSDVLDLILTPLLTLLITAIIFVFIIIPVAGYLPDGLVSALSVIINPSDPIVNVISGFILATLFLPMVLLGLYHGLAPIYATQPGAMGGASLFLVLAMIEVGQAGAAIAIYFMTRKIKNTKLQEAVTGALPAGLLGVGEPLIYGVTLLMSKPFVTTGIGAGLGGAYVMLTHVLANSWGPSGLVAVPIMKPESILNFFIDLVISCVARSVIIYFVAKEPGVRNT